MWSYARSLDNFALWRHLRALDAHRLYSSGESPLRHVRCLEPYEGPKASERLLEDSWEFPERSPKGFGKLPESFLKDSSSMYLCIYVYIYMSCLFLFSNPALQTSCSWPRRGADVFMYG